MKKIYPRAKEHLLRVTPYKPGKPIEEIARELNIKTEIIKLASNENPMGPSSHAIMALKKYLKECYFYPDDKVFYLKKKLSEKHKVSPEEIFVGNGSVEILYYIAQAFAGPGDSIAFCKGSFAMYKIVTDIVGAEPVMPPLKEENKSVDPIALLNSIKENTRIVFLSNPNNPTGTSFTHREEEKLIRESPEDVLLVFDEAYHEFVESMDFPRTMELYGKHENVVILRTFSKTFGLAGLRIGYAIARGEIVSSLMKVRIPFNVNRLGQIAALNAMDDKEHIRKSVEHIKREKKYLYRAYKELNLLYLPSDTNFIYVEFPEPAEFIFKKLLKRGIITRPLGPLFPNGLRITIGTREQNQRLIASLKEILYT